MKRKETNQKRERVFSGIRPSGQLHLGNYLGAIKHWIALQDTHECIFGIMDYHGITTPYDPKKYRDGVIDVVLDYLAAGLDPERSVFMIQSHVPEHLELAWMLGSIASVSLLSRIPTYKEKIKLHPQYVNLGLLSYPVLMASDILIYKATQVPVGEDQLPHIELANDLARKFNHQFGTTFENIHALLNREGSRIMSLQNPMEKMSKTGSSGIALNDTPDMIREKIKKAVTDTAPSGNMTPGVKNLFILMSFFSSADTYETFKKQHDEGTIRYAAFKEKLAEDIASGLSDFRKKRKELEENPDIVFEILHTGSSRAREISQDTLQEVKEKMGFLV